jgi:hypothetical protein
MKALAVFIILVVSCIFSAVHGLTEEDRLREYAKRNYTWPIKEFLPPTKGWDKLMRKRLAQVAELEDRVRTVLSDHPNKFGGQIQGKYISSSHIDVANDGLASFFFFFFFLWEKYLQNQRYEGYVQTMRSAFVPPNFTEYGFGLARCPDNLLIDLQSAIHKGLP